MALSSLPFDELDKYYLANPRTNVDYRRRNYLGHPTHRGAKDLTVFLYELGALTGKAPVALSSAPYDGCAFPLARKLTLILVEHPLVKKCTANGGQVTFKYDTPQVEASIDALVKRIKLMALIMAIEYGVQPILRGEPCVLDQFSNGLATQLYQISFRADHDRIFECVDHVELQMDLIRHLTHVSYISGSSVNNSYQYIQLARNSTATLQSLAILCEHSINLQGLVMDIDDNHVSYPRLRKLGIHEIYDSSGLERPVSYGAAPFPILQRLHSR
ncbi:hypothetical protein IWW37_004821 [Coemansia sp. RSA 2050]|nr:hypothetical protein IWW37_004821 [Coemansia sp. RSA 2050]